MAEIIMHELTINIPNVGGPRAVRNHLFSFFDQEEFGTKDVTMGYCYKVDTFSNGCGLYLKRPGRFGGHDFVVIAEGYNYAAPGKAVRNKVSFDDLKVDLLIKYEEDQHEYSRFYDLLERIYYCVGDVTDEEIASIHFKSGIPVEYIIKPMKFLFIEQDQKQSNRAGRQMPWAEVIPDKNGHVEEKVEEVKQPKIFIPDGSYSAKRKRSATKGPIIVKATVNNGEWILPKGSTISPIASNSIGPEAKKQRAKINMTKGGRLREEINIGNVSPLLVARIITGQNTDGWKFFKDVNGKTIEVYKNKT